MRTYVHFSVWVSRVNMLTLPALVPGAKQRKRRGYNFSTGKKKKKRCKISSKIFSITQFVSIKYKTSIGERNGDELMFWVEIYSKARARSHPTHCYTEGF